MDSVESRTNLKQQTTQNKNIRRRVGLGAQRTWLIMDLYFSFASGLRRKAQICQMWTKLYGLKNNTLIVMATEFCRAREINLISVPLQKWIGKSALQDETRKCTRRMRKFLVCSMWQEHCRQNQRAFSKHRAGQKIPANDLIIARSSRMQDKRQTTWMTPGFHFAFSSPPALKSRGKNINFEL